MTGVQTCALPIWVFFEADFHGLTGRGFQRLAVAGFVDREDWQRLRFHPRSFAESARGGNSNLMGTKQQRRPLCESRQVSFARQKWWALLDILAIAGPRASGGGMQPAGSVRALLCAHAEELLAEAASGVGKRLARAIPRAVLQHGPVGREQVRCGFDDVGPPEQ